MEESLAVMDNLRWSILDTKKSANERHNELFSSSVLVLSVTSVCSSSLTVLQRLAGDCCEHVDSLAWKKSRRDAWIRMSWFTNR